MKLDSDGRCCGRKPLVYKRPPAHKYCTRCDRAYDSVTGEQLVNWAWEADARFPGGFARRTYRPVEITVTKG